MTFLSGLAPMRLYHAVQGRGIAGTAFHALRRAGTVAEKAFCGPQLIRINPMGFVCNHTCPMCWLQHLEPAHLKEQKKVDREQGMKLSDYEALFDSMPMGLLEVNVVGGGEPLVHPDAVGIMQSVKSHGWRGSLISNGTLMKEETARRMVEMGWDETRISVHAGDPETYKTIQGVDRFEAMRTNLKTFDRLRREAGKREQCHLTVFHVVQRENIPTIPKLFEIAEEVGADYIEFDKIIPYDEGKWLTAEELHSAQEMLEAGARQSKVPCNIGQIMPELAVEETCAVENKPFVPAKSCSVGFDQSFITAMGEVMPCCFSNEIMGNVREQPFRAIWRGDKYKRFRKRLINGKFPRYCVENRCTLPGVLHN